MMNPLDPSAEPSAHDGTQEEPPKTLTKTRLRSGKLARRPRVIDDSSEILDFLPFAEESSDLT
jgi:hypothetical protein